VPSRDRRDEIGAMAAAVQVFKDNMIENERLGVCPGSPGIVVFENARALSRFVAIAGMGEIVGAFC
jgi:methyl-accepting chemotaxis protein